MHFVFGVIAHFDVHFPQLTVALFVLRIVADDVAIVNDSIFGKLRMTGAFNFPLFTSS
jgi:hypothetical protein